MNDLKKWDLQRCVFRGLSGKPFDQSLSCGFLNKAGHTQDVINERYNRLAMVYVLRGHGSYDDERGIQHRLRAGDLSSAAQTAATTVPSIRRANGWSVSSPSAPNGMNSLNKSVCSIPIRFATTSEPTPKSPSKSSDTFSSWKTPTPPSATTMSNSAWPH